VSGTIGARIGSILVGTATAIIIVTIAIVPFLTPPWLAFEQGRAQATAWTGYSEADLATVTNAIVADLVVGPPDFDVELGGTPVLNERERSHMRDVRTVFLGLWILAAASLLVLAVAVARADRAHAWRAVSRGAATLAVGVVAIGVVALVAFDVLFELFHRVFFAGGTYTFDPGEERLVQLFPFQFWQETAMAVGAVIVVLCAIVWRVATTRQRVGRQHAAPVHEPARAATEGA
jgi:integral membrane protein (TIGR01906 family)